jgi:hypothetical protein
VSKFIALIKGLTLISALSVASYSSTSNAQQVDPTKPFNSAVTGLASQQSGEVEQLRLESIIMKNNKTNAIINGKFLKVGDKVGEFKIEKISANSVNLTSTGTNMTLSLFTDVLMKSK